MLCYFAIILKTLFSFLCTALSIFSLLKTWPQLPSISLRFVVFVTQKFFVPHQFVVVYLLVHNCGHFIFFPNQSPPLLFLLKSLIDNQESSPFCVMLLNLNYMSTGLNIYIYYKNKEVEKISNYPKLDSYKSGIY